MRGSSHTSHTPDPQKRAEWMSQLAERTEVTPEQLVGLFPPEWVARADRHQRMLGNLAIKDAIEQPLPRALNEEDAELRKLALNNIGGYDDEVEDLIYEDELIGDLLAAREQYTGSEEYSELMRARRTVVAHYIFSVMTEEMRPGAA
jgi:hypothetical protein